MKQFNKIRVYITDRIEKVILEWIWIRRFRIILFAILTLLLIAISKAPYINLFFSDYLLLFFTTILAPFVLDIKVRPLFVLAIILLILAFILWVIDDDTGGFIFNYLFIVLFSGMLKIISSE